MEPVALTRRTFLGTEQGDLPTYTGEPLQMQRVSRCSHGSLVQQTDGIAQGTSRFSIVPPGILVETGGCYQAF
jgi:hypothetical protein